MIYLDMSSAEFFKDKKGVQVYVQQKCTELGHDFNKIKFFKTQKSYGVELDKKGLITLHIPHNQELWKGNF